eukprot:COSAG06_NODE_6905_length_2722_cov_7.052818_3_plen_36_part_00
MDDILNRLVEEDMPELTKISGAYVLIASLLCVCNS